MISQVKIISAGYCTHPGWTVIKGGGRKPIRFPSSVAVIEHGLHGVILFDTGYTSRVFDETTKFPARFFDGSLRKSMLPLLEILAFQKFRR